MFIHKQLDYSVVFQCVTFGINIVLVIIRSLYKVEQHVAKVSTCLRQITVGIFLTILSLQIFFLNQNVNALFDHCNLGLEPERQRNSLLIDDNRYSNRDKSF